MFFFRKKNKEPKSTLILQPIGHWLNGDKKITRTKTDAWSCQAANLLHDLSFSGLLLSRLYVTLCHRLHPHHSSFFFVASFTLNELIFIFFFFLFFFFSFFAIIFCITVITIQMEVIVIWKRFYFDDNCAKFLFLFFVKQVIFKCIRFEFFENVNWCKELNCLFVKKKKGSKMWLLLVNDCSHLYVVAFRWKCFFQNYKAN